MPTPRVLILGFVWPEPRSSAAGLRSWQLIRALERAGWDIVFASAARENEALIELRAAGIRCEPVLLNDSSFDRWVREERFDFVIFDRFMIEEQFGWRIAEASPATIRILDTIDLHFLRRARQSAIEAGTPTESVLADGIDPLEWGGEDAFREVASIYRCDLSLLLSDHETRLLLERCEVPPHLLMHFTLGYAEPSPLVELPPFEARRGFAVIGNFRHAPNADGNRWLRREIWPLIRKRLPEAEIHIFGAYPARADMELGNARDGFFVEGPAPDALQALQSRRIVLAPLRFGAGIKGKIIDGWRAGAPVVTTPIGTEGMLGLDGEFGGEAAPNAEEFARLAVELHEGETEWEAKRRAGRKILAECFAERELERALIEALSALRANVAAHRSRCFTSQMLSRQALRGTKYLSKWIEEKNRDPQTATRGARV
jgi:O-antigen biosynthesis protein